MGTLPCDLLLEVHEWSACLGEHCINRQHDETRINSRVLSSNSRCSRRSQKLLCGSWSLPWTVPFHKDQDNVQGCWLPIRMKHPFGPILIPEDQDAKICIRFPARDGRPETWRHDLGSKGACANQCCEFKPPLKNPPPPAPQPTWFETSSDCSNTAGAIEGPTLFKGKDLDEKSICFKLEDGSFELRKGFLNNCGAGCCIFYVKPLKKNSNRSEPNNVQD